MLVTFLIFIVLFFLYVHITAHYKKNEDLEIYEMDFTTNHDLQDVCNVKQPIIFDFRACCPELFEKDGINLDKICEKYDKFLVKVKDSNDYWAMPVIEVVDAVPLSLGNYRTLAMTDSRARYYTDGNEFFMEDSGLQSTVEKVDEYLKPNYTVHKTYDILTGSAGTCMPMQYHNHFRRFLIVTSGHIHVKMTPWKSSKYLHPITDYENYEFRSLTNVWNPTANKSEKIRADYDRIQFEEFDVHAGYVLYIPPYWWYSVKFADNANTVFINATYDSAITMIADSADLARHFLQLQSNKEIVTRTLVAEPKPVKQIPPELAPNAEIDGKQPIKEDL
jgi:mannose-6-phosphate isomerase-like protein (cupin superfamily)